MTEGCSLRRHLDALVIALFFLSAPVALLIVGITDLQLVNIAEVSWRTMLVYGVAAPLVGSLLLVQHRRARFAAYIFLTMELVRSLMVDNLPAAAVVVALVLYLQTPRMRRLYPSIKPAEILARLRARS